MTMSLLWHHVCSKYTNTILPIIYQQSLCKSKLEVSVEINHLDIYVVQFVQKVIYHHYGNTKLSIRILGLSTAVCILCIVFEYTMLSISGGMNGIYTIQHDYINLNVYAYGV